MSIKNDVFKTRLISSLEKVFPDEELKAENISEATALNNEVYSFQVAYLSSGSLEKNIQVSIKSELESVIKVRSVGLVPSEFPIYHDHDENILRNQAGLFPDPLYPLTDEGITLFPKQWRSLWVRVNLNDTIEAGTYPIEIVFKHPSGEVLATEHFELEVLPVSLPKQSLIHTQWLHTDCISEQYKVDVFSETYWEWVEKYIKTAVSHGVNMILTPLFTPPLDTLKGEERPTVQLVEVEKKGETYLFNFERLTRWITMCLKNGVEYIEFSHLFTQWGAYHAPKIKANINGKNETLFGWDTEANGKEYEAFLSVFLPELINYIQKMDIEKKVFFHVSDEPMLEQLDSYKYAQNIIKKHLKDLPIIDALSDYDFHEKGIVGNPIPSTDHIEPFIQNDVKNLWTYYCCGQYKKVANRFFTFPSARNRIIGIQLYKYDIKGFLHWGYNFWFSQLSRKVIDPFKCTDADAGFPSGDVFVVYPGENEPIDSLRLEVFYDGLQDIRALQLLENYIGKDEVMNLIEQDLKKPISFEDYPQESSWLLMKRSDINERIRKAYQDQLSE